MEKAKSKKKLVAIIAGSALAFILTVVVSVAVTLAYFGQTDTANTGITLGEALEFTADSVVAKVAGSAELENALPGQPANITVDGEIAPSSTQAFLVAQLAFGGELDAADITNATIKLGEAEAVAMGVYSVTDNNETPENAEDDVTTTYLYHGSDSSCSAIDVTDGKEVTITVTYRIPASLTNTAEGDTMTVTATLSIVQTKYLGTDGADSSAIADVVAALAQVEAAA